MRAIHILKNGQELHTMPQFLPLTEQTKGIYIHIIREVKNANSI